MSYNDEEKTVMNPAASDSEVTRIVSQPQAERTQMAAAVECPVCHTINASTETYCSDCGFLLSSSPVSVEMPETQEPSARLVAPDGREFVLNPGVNTVGRVDSDVLIPDPTVSRKHAEIALREGAWWLTDLGSTNGTFIDGAQLKANAPVQLVNGSSIKFGTSAMVFEVSEVAPPAAPAAETTVVVSSEEAEAEESEAAAEETREELIEEESAGGAEVEVRAADAIREYEVEPVEAEAEPVEPEVVEPEEPAVAGKLVNLADPSANYLLASGVNTIGRAPDNSIQIVGDPYVSGHHAQIVYQDGNFTLIDVGSTNGTLLNGQPVPKQEPQELNPGDEIGIGQGRYRLEA
jgi:pSer/pThr/pTyr-binding forkhead associated (FHA) protein